MKRFLGLCVAMLLLCACQKDETRVAVDEARYLGMIELIESCDAFLPGSNNFDIHTEMAKTDEGYRYYVVIDNPRSALYDVEAIVLVDGVDHEENMAASIGLFEETEYSLIPNQTNPDKGYVAGIVMSGSSEAKDLKLSVLVQWKNSERTLTNKEFFRLETSYEEEHEQ